MITNRQLLLPYAAPYLAYVGLASIPRDYLSAEASYLLRLVVVPLLLVWAWRWYCSLRGPRSLRGSILIGAGAGWAYLKGRQNGPLTNAIHAFVDKNRRLFGDD